MIDPKTLATMRAAASQYLLSAVEVLSVATTHDRFGRETVTYTVDATHRGQLSAITGAERELLTAMTADGVLRTRTARLALPWGTAITEGQAVRVAGETWNIAAVIANETLGAHVVALLTREAHG